MDGCYFRGRGILQDLTEASCFVVGVAQAVEELLVVPHDLAFYHVDNFFGNVRRQVTDPFQLASDIFESQ